MQGLDDAAAIATAGAAALVPRAARRGGQGPWANDPSWAHSSASASNCQVFNTDIATAGRGGVGWGMDWELALKAGSELVSTSLLEHLAAFPSLRVVRDMLREGANLATITEEGDTALHLSCRRASIDIIAALVGQVEKQSTLNKPNKAGCTALHYAVRRGGEKVVRCLVENPKAVRLSWRVANNEGKTPDQMLRLDASEAYRQYILQTAAASRRSEAGRDKAAAEQKTAGRASVDQNAEGRVTAEQQMDDEIELKQSRRVRRRKHRAAVRKLIALGRLKPRSAGQSAPPRPPTASPRREPAVHVHDVAPEEASWTLAAGTRPVSQHTSANDSVPASRVGSSSALLRTTESMGCPRTYQENKFDDADAQEATVELLCKQFDANAAQLNSLLEDELQNLNALRGG